MADFKPEDYWETRLRERYGLHGVGYISLGKPFNQWMYRVRQHVFQRTVRGYVPTPAQVSVLDVGSGTGFYIEQWQALGVRNLTGSDLTQVAVEQLRQKFPAFRFEQLNIGGGVEGIESQRFDIVSAFDVLFHIVNDAQYERAFENIAGLLKPSGLFIFSENLVHRKRLTGETQVNRSLDEIEAILDRSGFEVIERKPMFVLMNSPVDSRNPLHWFFWRALNVSVRTAQSLGWIAGALLYPLELLLLMIVREGPSTEMVICRKRP